MNIFLAQQNKNSNENKLLKKNRIITRNLWYSPCNNNKNVGDLIGIYIFNKITNGKINHIHPTNTNEKVYMTCGSLIKYENVKNNNTIIWGSGLMFDKIKKFDSIIFAVRGKETKKVLDKLGIKCPKVFGDIGLLLPRFFNPNVEIIYDIGVIFHYQDKDKNLVDLLKEFYNVNFINVNLPVEDFIIEVKKCKYTISSSLHGVIISHAYNIKSVPFHLQKNGINNTFFKFEDYYSCFDLNFVKIFREDILNKNLLELINEYQQPKFPIDTNLLYDSCPFRIK